MNKISSLFDIKYPIVQGGMVWASGWKMASAVSNAGGLGLLGAGSMYPDVFKEHVQKCKKATDKPFGVNIPLLYPNTEELIQILLEEKVPVVFSSAGSPKKYTPHLQAASVKVAHVVSSSKFAVKCQDAGVDAVVAEGFEAGGHNGAEETTTMALIPSVRKAIEKPLIAAGGIASGKAMLAAMVLGADAVQIGSLFAASKESSCHDKFKEAIVDAKEGDTLLRLKKVGATRLLLNEFAQQVIEAENAGASKESLAELLGKGRAKKGMFEGNMQEGELEIGQVSAQINEIKSIEEIMNELIADYQQALKDMDRFHIANL